MSMDSEKSRGAAASLNADGEIAFADIELELVNLDDAIARRASAH